MKILYGISGLGADERIFSRLEIPGTKLVPLQWITPVKNESIQAYARRMLEQVKDQAHPIRFIGVSFGGIMALEMAKLLPGAEVILVSSIMSRRELPRWMRLAGNLRLHKLLPLHPPRWRKLEDHFLGAEGKEERALVEQFRGTADPYYLKWALQQVITWQNDWQPAVCYHLHGTKDRTFPIGRIKPTHIVRGGGHFMIMNRAAEMNAILGAIS